MLPPERYYASDGEKQWIGGSPDDTRMRARGEADGYPACCIDEFVADCKAGRYPAGLRGVLTNGCVPCSMHATAQSGRFT